MMPRVIKVTKAHAYLSMGRHTFDREIRPHCNIVRLTDRTKGIDRQELDQVWEAYKKRNIVRRAKKMPGEREECQEYHQDFTKGKAEPGTSTSSSKATGDFAKAVRRKTEQRRNGD